MLVERASVDGSIDIAHLADTYISDGLETEMFKVSSVLKYEYLVRSCMSASESRSAPPTKPGSDRGGR